MRGGATSNTAARAWRATPASSRRTAFCTTPSSSASRRGADRAPGTPSDRAGAELAAAEPPVQFERLANDHERLGRPEEVLDLDGLVLESLVVLEKALDLALRVGRELDAIPVVGERGVAHVHGEDLVVDAFVVPHAHEPDRSRLDDRER